MDLIILAFMGVTANFNLPPSLLSSLCYVESNHRVSAIHIDDGRENSIGICQLHTSTARMLGFKGTEKELMNPKTNIYYAGKFLRKNLDRYKGDIVKAVAAYNSGTYKEKNGLAFNQNYVTLVFKAWSARK